MSRVYLAFAVLVVAGLGAWGCTQGPGNRVALTERVKSLESKSAKLEDEIRGVAAARDEARQLLFRAEQHIQKLQAVVHERDDLRLLVKVRTSERDQLAGQFDQFRKSLVDLLGDAESTVLRFPDGEPVTVSITLPSYGRGKEY
jgi:exonuclease VII small subunit